jgi:hypothetical protein
MWGLQKYTWGCNSANYKNVVCVFAALFAAVEHGHVDKARTILESTDVDVNR